MLIVDSPPPVFPAQIHFEDASDDDEVVDSLFVDDNIRHMVLVRRRLRMCGGGDDAIVPHRRRRHRRLSYRYHLPFSSTYYHCRYRHRRRRCRRIFLVFGPSSHCHRQF